MMNDLQAETGENGMVNDSYLAYWDHDHDLCDPETCIFCQSHQIWQGENLERSRNEEEKDDPQEGCFKAR